MTSDFLTAEVCESGHRLRERDEEDFRNDEAPSGLRAEDRQSGGQVPAGVGHGPSLFQHRYYEQLKINLILVTYTNF